jgi:hypothetical protein
LLNPDFRDMLSALHAENAEFLIVGSYAVAAYGGQRATADIDIWVRPSADNSLRVMRALARDSGHPPLNLSPRTFRLTTLSSKWAIRRGGLIC